MLKRVGALVIRPSVRRRLWLWRNRGFAARPRVGESTPDSLWRTSPISQVWGLDRGIPIDRYYIDRFLGAHAGDIRGRVLEVADDTYTVRFGGTRVTRSETLHVEHGHPGVTIVGDLCTGANLDSNAFDCIILTQTLPVLPDLQGAVATLHRILAPGGVLLITTPGVSKLSRYDADRWGYYWNLTCDSTELLLKSHFAPDDFTVESLGNVLSAVCVLHGLASHELRYEDLDLVDPDYQVLVVARAVKPPLEH